MRGRLILAAKGTVGRGLSAGKLLDSISSNQYDNPNSGSGAKRILALVLPTYVVFTC